MARKTIGNLNILEKTKSLASGFFPQMLSSTTLDKFDIVCSRFPTKVAVFYVENTFNETDTSCSTVNKYVVENSCDKCSNSSISSTNAIFQL